MDEELDTLPTSRPLHDVDAIERIIDAGVPDVHQGYGGRVLEMGKRYQAIAQEYPRIGKYVHVYHPDLQGPMDICEIIWGSTMFYSLYDRPDLVKALLEVVTETYITFMRAWTEIVPFREGGNVHWGLFHKGINIVGLNRDAAEEAVATGRDLHGRVHAWVAKQNLRGDADTTRHRSSA